MPLLTFEDFHEGKIWEFGDYLVSKEEILEFANKYDPQSFHIDEEAAKASQFGGLIASGWHTCAIMMRMLCDGLFSHARGGSSPGIDEIRWLRPVRPEDRLRLRVEVAKVAPSRSKPDRGTVWNQITIFNQKDEAVATIKAMTIVFKRDATPGLPA